MTSDLCKGGVRLEHEASAKISGEVEEKPVVDFVVTANLPTKYGDFLVHGFENKITGEHHVALSIGDIDDGEPVLTRVHSECLTGDVFGSAKCDCGDQFAAAMDAISHAGRGVMIYLRQEGRGIGLGFPADMRDYTAGAEMLKYLGVKKLRLLTNNPMKIEGLEKFGIDIVERIPIETTHKEPSDRYMTTKKIKMGHLLKTY